MTHKDGIVATIALALSTLAMAGMVGSGAYAQAAGIEARGVQALSNAVIETVCPEAHAARAADAQLLAVAAQVAP